MRYAFAIALSLTVIVGRDARADDWPQWRGTKRDGAWTEKGIVGTFPSTGLAPLWRASVGAGWSSPVVAQGRVYVFDSELQQPLAWERVHCFEETTGKPLWTHRYEVSYPDWAFDPTSVAGPNATPIVRDGKLYTVGATG